MNALSKIFIALLAAVVLISCNKQSPQSDTPEKTYPEGSLYIIGGGSRPDSMVKDMMSRSGTDTTGYILILPMSSSEPDTALFYGMKQFTDLGADNVFGFRFPADSIVRPEQIDSIRNARLIYITGGSQIKFMQSLKNNDILSAIKEAYENGSMIAGTSAGAAVMSKKMITGDERKHPEYTGFFPTIEANNIILEEGLGMLDKCIIDQHFIQRQRLNRLIAVCLENPEELCIGIDESTAIFVHKGQATVTGESQVMTLKHGNAETKVANGLIGGKNLQLSIYLPGENFDIPQ